MASGPMERVSGDDSPHAADIGRDALAVMVRQVPLGVLGTCVAAVLLVALGTACATPRVIRLDTGQGAPLELSPPTSHKPRRHTKKP